ncbi:MAG: nucleoside recognition domain-containing protein [Eubacteriales bacterium]
MVENIIHDIFFGSISIIINFFKILIPLMIIVEILMAYKLIEKLSNKLEFLAKALRMEKQSIFPLMVGVFMGLTYGAGTLIEINRKTPIPKKDFILIGVFLFVCHGIIETSMIFAVAGANIWVVSIGRLFLAFIITVVAARIPIINRIGHDNRD